MASPIPLALMPPEQTSDSKASVTVLARPLEPQPHPAPGPVALREGRRDQTTKVSHELH